MMMENSDEDDDEKGNENTFKNLVTNRKRKMGSSMASSRRTTPGNATSEMKYQVNFIFLTEGSRQYFFVNIQPPLCFPACNCFVVLLLVRNYNNFCFCKEFFFLFYAIRPRQRIFCSFLGWRKWNSSTRAISGW